MIRFSLRQAIARKAVVAAGLCFFGAGAALFYPARLNAQKNAPALTDQEKLVSAQIKGLRSLPDDVRPGATKTLAIQIRGLSDSPNRLLLADSLAHLSTEGDLGQDTVQEVATTLASALKEAPPSENRGQPAEPYFELARLVRYEHVDGSSDDPQFAAAVSQLQAHDALIEKASFSLTGLDGKTWTLQDLHGQVVLVNFWATWCPPCRKEVPELEALYDRFKSQGFVVLAITYEDASKVQPFVTDFHILYPELLDPTRGVIKQFQVHGVPESFVYDRDGKLVTEAMDLRTEGQFIKMLAQAGLQ